MAEPALAALPAPAAGWDALRDDPGPDSVRCLGLYARLAAGVAVVTALQPGGAPSGTTVSSLTSVSARPPLLLVCLRHGSRTLAALTGRGTFAVSLLTERQQRMAERFADPAVPHAARFAGLPVRRVLGLPVLADGLGWAVCLVEDVRRYGDHQLVVGRVRAVEAGDGRPLLWHARSFHALE
ncbi:flavin reductase family protein [Streptomyces sp. XM83C]|jgi:flavin reductase (DIM6/NTAB) family NADH-FMN oxidoreductase RutF|uniref:Flavin reductase family protein n=1 Tax=Streptomyces thermocoprophilus TaxID=78356 RepID=A0ABV5V866_9ACTN|nr:flavin reductase family protein [Streptomyces sp. XM83C]MCK1821760.1 flavin reductase family protein [Streptomyces sp. XM83C]